jgi:hypothetical protein
MAGAELACRSAAPGRPLHHRAGTPPSSPRPPRRGAFPRSAFAERCPEAVVALSVGSGMLSAFVLLCGLVLDGFRDLVASELAAKGAGRQRGPAGACQRAGGQRCGAPAGAGAGPARGQRGASVRQVASGRQGAQSSGPAPRRSGACRAVFPRARTQQEREGAGQAQPPHLQPKAGRQPPNQIPAPALCRQSPLPPQPPHSPPPHARKAAPAWSAGNTREFACTSALAFVCFVVYLAACVLLIAFRPAVEAELGIGGRTRQPRGRLSPPCDAPPAPCRTALLRGCHVRPFLAGRPLLTLALSPACRGPPPLPRRRRARSARAPAGRAAGRRR